MLLAAAAVLVLGSTGSLILHSRTGGGPASANASAPSSACPSPDMAHMDALPCGATPSPDLTPFPTAAETALMARMPDFVDRHRCLRNSSPYHKALADVTCSVAGDAQHPGASTISYQQFTDYASVEEHFNHQTNLHLSGQSNDPLCPPTPSAAMLTTYPQNGKRQQELHSQGHFYCQKNAQAVPYVVWSNASWLISGELAGDGPGDMGHLLTFWKFAGPIGDPTGSATAAEVNNLYKTYVGRETGEDTTFWINEINRVGYPEARNEFATSCTAVYVTTLPALDEADQKTFLAKLTSEGCLKH